MAVGSTIKQGLSGVKTRRLLSIPPRWPIGEWTPPSDWLKLPDISGNSQRAVALVGIWDNPTNYIALSCVAVSGYTVDWGDGSAPQNFANGVVAEHQYDYADVDLPAATSEGMKQAIISVTPQAGNITQYNFGKRHSALPAVVGSSGLLDVKIIGSVLNSLIFTGAGAVIEHKNLKRVEVIGSTVITSMASAFVNCTALEVIKGTAWTSSVQAASNMFQGCESLKTIPLFDFPALTTCNSMFSGCDSLVTIPLINTAGCTNMSSMFNACRSLKSIPLLNTGNNTIWTSFCNTCVSLQEVPLWDTSKGTNFTNMFAGCVSLRKVPAYDTHLGTVFNGMFSGCTNLMMIPALDMSAASSAANFNAPFVSLLSLGKCEAFGAKYSHTYANSRLTAAELDRIYTNLGTAAGAQTITVTGNPGTSGDTPSIATAKGWTVTGS